MRILIALLFVSFTASADECVDNTREILKLLRGKPADPLVPPVTPPPAKPNCEHFKTVAPFEYLRCMNEALPPEQPPAPPPVTPAPPPSPIQPGHFGAAGDKLEIRAASGQVTAIPLPKTPKASGYLNILDSPGLNSPPSSLLEISISKTPGDMNGCTRTFRDVGYVSQYWFARTTTRFNTPQAIQAAGACYAPESEGQWYLNVRWTYSQCSFGAATCGFKFYWSPGAY